MLKTEEDKIVRVVVYSVPVEVCDLPRFLSIVAVQSKADAAATAEAARTSATTSVGTGLRFAIAHPLTVGLTECVCAASEALAFVILNQRVSSTRLLGAVRRP